MRWYMSTTVESGTGIALAPCLDDSPRTDTVLGHVIEPPGQGAADGPRRTAHEHATAPQRVLRVLDRREAARRSRIGQRDEIERGRRQRALGAEIGQAGDAVVVGVRPDDEHLTTEPKWHARLDEDVAPRNAQRAGGHACDA